MGPPGQPSRIISPEQASDLATIDYTDADIRFLQGMVSHHTKSFELMPGMLSAEEFVELEQASSLEFDSLYLNYMINHHNGALEMVEDLLDQFGSVQDVLLVLS